MLQQEGEHGSVGVGRGSGGSQAVTFSRVNLELVGPAQGDQLVHQKRRVSEQDVLIVQPVKDEQTVWSGGSGEGRRGGGEEGGRGGGEEGGRGGGEEGGGTLIQ